MTVTNKMEETLLKHFDEWGDIQKSACACLCLDLSLRERARAD